MMDCFNDHVCETVKIQVATTNIILGLTPTVLSMLDSSTFELCILSTQRPLLVLCVSLGSSTVWPMRPFQHVDLQEEMKVRAQRRKIPRMNWVDGTVVTALQDATVLGSIAIVANISYELSSKSISYTFSCNQRFGLLLWIFLAAAIHLGG
jgi:hypothetical protein